MKILSFRPSAVVAGASLWFVVLGSPAWGEEVGGFSGPDLAIVGRPYTLAVPPGGCLVDWGDLATETVAGGTATHVYNQPGVVSISVKKGDRPLVQDAAVLIKAARPAWSQPQSEPFELKGDAQSLGALLKTPVDSFSIAFRVKADGGSGNCTLFASGGANGANLGLKDGTLTFKLGDKLVASEALGDRWSDKAWHHLAVTYDRVPLFRKSNQVRFYLDGVPAGLASFEVADAGAVTAAKASVGGAGFHGEIDSLAVYDSLLFPLAISDQAAALAGNQKLAVTVATPAAEAVEVKEPVITTTVKLALDPNPAADNGPALRKALAALNAGERLQLAGADGKGGGSFHVRSLKAAPEWAGMILQGKTDVELDGNGCTLVFADNMARYLLMKDCTRAAVRNLSFDIDPAYARVGMYAKIVSADPASGEVKAQVVNGRDGKPVKDLPKRASYWRWRPHDPVTLRLAKSGPYFQSGTYARKPEADTSGPGMINFKLRVPATDKLWKEIAGYQKGDNFYMINNGDFSCNAVSLDDSSHITFDRVNYHAVLGMVFLSSAIDHLHVVHCKIGLPPGMTAADRPLSAGADGYHFHLTRGSILFEENEIALTDDDPVSIKDDIWTTLKRIDDRRLDYGGKSIRAGYPVELFGPDYVPTGYKAKVVQADGPVLTLDRDLPADIPAKSVLVNRDHHTRDWILRNNYFHDYYGRVMIYADHGTVVGNRVHNSYYHLGISDANFERAGITSDVITHRNLFEGTYADTSKWGGDGSVPGFHGITYSANSFLGRDLKLNSADGALVARNWFWRDKAEQSPPVSLSCSPCTVLVENVDAVSSATGFRVKAEKSPETKEIGNRTAR
ncbi:MAG: hypothetical protein QM755_15320 [Luteolibacter sp.]